mmetsp:Transcript_58044/g.147382  ORF Transcript_58044/g.147382 Transcript_58044/m.147382 type:complete len:202 (+) Transcript_58044:267-872(+)
MASWCRPCNQRSCRAAPERVMPMLCELWKVAQRWGPTLMENGRTSGGSLKMLRPWHARAPTRRSSAVGRQWHSHSTSRLPQKTGGRTKRTLPSRARTSWKAKNLTTALPVASNRIPLKLLTGLMPRMCGPVCQSLYMPSNSLRVHIVWIVGACRRSRAWSVELCFTLPIFILASGIYLVRCRPEIGNRLVQDASLLRMFTT